MQFDGETGSRFPSTPSVSSQLRAHNFSESVVRGCGPSPCVPGQLLLDHGEREVPCDAASRQCVPGCSMWTQPVVHLDWLLLSK